MIRATITATMQFARRWFAEPDHLVPGEPEIGLALRQAAIALPALILLATLVLGLLP
ncbi:hypothetical protein [Sphingobium aquiterrae]|uniref:hypothetical protein n=1 Tax=Sphingobium aquiterrae TaxID=2038656 RepID=UPI0030163A57